MTRLRSLSLSLALHGGALVGLMWLGFGRAPHDEAPQGITVVWLDSGLSDLAASSRGDGGEAEETEPDRAAEPLPIPVFAVDAADHPAPPHPDARDPISGADRPALPPSASADDVRPLAARAPGEQRAEPPEDESPPTEAPSVRPDASAEALAEAREAPTQMRESTAAETLPTETSVSAQARQPAADEAVLDEAISTVTAASPELPADAPAAVPRMADAAALPTPVPVELPPPAPNASARPARAADASAQARSASVAEPVTLPVPPSEQETLLAEVVHLLSRSQDMPSRPSIAWSRKGQEYRATLTRVIPAGATGIDEAIIEVTTERDGRHVSTELRMKRLAFSHYAQFVDRWDPEVQIHDDEIDGRFHSNSDIVIANAGGIQPVFHGKVTTTGDIDTTRSDRRVRRNQVFLGGVETRTARIALPRRFAPLEALAADADNIVALESDSRITFFADGRYAVEPIFGGKCRGPGGTRRSGTLGASPVYFVAAEKCAVAVKGTVNGQVLVYSPVEIVIEGDLVYAADPKRTANADDYLGLVSDGTVEIADPGVTGPGDLTVHAAIYAKRLFAVRRYTRGDRATLMLYGSLTAGSLTATEPRYRTKLEFDPRLEHARPPSFPMTDRYELASWDAVWRPVGE